MTRFARARGSKAHNERLPEEATPWCILKQQVEERMRPDNEHPVTTANSDHLNLHNKGRKISEVKVWEEFDGHIVPSTSSRKSKNENIVDTELNMKTKIKKRKFDQTEPPKHLINVDEISESNGKNIFIVEETLKGFTNNNSSTHTDEVNLFKKKKKDKRQFADVTYSNEEVNFPTLKETVDKKPSNQKTKALRVDSLEIDSAEVDRQQNIEEGNDLDNSKNIKFLGDKLTNKSSFSQYSKLNKNIRNKASYQNGFQNVDRRPPKSALINGKMVEISNFQGFTVKKEDADRLYSLRKDLRSKGVPRAEVMRVLQMERRKAEKALTRDKKVVCFVCRKSGHSMEECLELGDKAFGICFKCGSTEHSVGSCRVVRTDSFKFAHCFICQEQGHLARQCPDNPRGLYPKGGACRECGDVTHLKKDCPTLVTEKEKTSFTVGRVHNSSIEGLDEELINCRKSTQKKTNIVKF